MRTGIQHALLLVALLAVPAPLYSQGQPRQQPQGQGGARPAKAQPAQPPASATKRDDGQATRQGQPQPVRDAVADAQTPRAVQAKRAEQQLTEYDRSGAFDPNRAPSVSPAITSQAKEGKMKGFDFARDPLNSDAPQRSAKDIMEMESAARPAANQAQRALLESRYNLTPQYDPEAKMSRGKAICVGPTARLSQGVTWEALATMSADDMRRRNAF